ncbi:MAG: DUF4928 family protein [Planctomycetota bacterium]
MTAIALIEKLREDPTVDLAHHVDKVRNGFKSQNRYAEAGIARLGLKGDFGEYGRRSNDLAVWGPKLMELLRDVSSARWNEAMEAAHAHLADLWRMIYSTEPLRPNFGIGAAAAVVADLLAQAETYGTAPVFASCLVGAKLELRLGIDLPVATVNAPDRSARDRSEDKPADFEVGDAAVEVTLNSPDQKHLRQCETIVRDWKREAWLIVYGRDVVAWTKKIAERLGADAGMVNVQGIEVFVGQNMAEMGRFDRPATIDELKRLFMRHNERWAGPTEAPTVVL